MGYLLALGLQVLWKILKGYKGLGAREILIYTFKQLTNEPGLIGMITHKHTPPHTHIHF